MTEMIHYVANDGKYFSDREECLLYETIELSLRQCYDNKELACFVESCWRYVPYEVLRLEPEQTLIDATIVVAFTDNAVRAWNALCDVYGYDHIDGIGYHIYDTDMQQWYNTQERMKYWIAERNNIRDLLRREKLVDAEG